jgi:UDP-N-acetylglucosamine 2-epimerase (non-hydrolysing)
LTAKIVEILKSSRATYLLAFGDVTSTVAATRAGRLSGRQVLHYEGGLRCSCGEPEERNRIEADEQSDVIYVTEPSGIEHLKRERRTAVAVLVGNVQHHSCNLLTNGPKA